MILKHKASKSIYFLDIQPREVCEGSVFSKKTAGSLCYYFMDWPHPLRVIVTFTFIVKIFQAKIDNFDSNIWWKGGEGWGVRTIVYNHHIGNKQCKFRQNIKWIGLENCRINNMRLKCLLCCIYLCLQLWISTQKSMSRSR